MPDLDPFAAAGAAPAGWLPGAPPPAPARGMVPVIDVGGDSNIDPSAKPGDPGSGLARSSQTSASGAANGAPVATVTVTAKPDSAGQFDPFAAAGAAPAGWMPQTAPAQAPTAQQPASTQRQAAAQSAQPPQAAPQPQAFPAPSQGAPQPGWLANLGGSVGAALTGVAQGTVGSKTVDYAAAALGTPWRMLTAGEGIGPAFSNQLAEEEAAEQQSKQQYPVETTIGQIGGALKTGLMLAPQLAYRAPQVAGLLPKVGAAASYLARNTGLGAGMAALNGEDPATGAAIGGGLAAGLPAANAVTLKPLRWVYGQLAPTWSGASREASVGRNLLRTGVAPGQLETAPLDAQGNPIGPLDLAQATNNAGVASKVRFAQGIAEKAAKDLRARQVQAVRDQLGEVAPEQSQADASQRLVNAVRGAGDAAKDQERALWNAPSLKSTQVQTQWLKGTVQKAVQNLEPGLRLGVTGPIKQALDQLANMPARASVGDLNSVRTALRLAGRPSESNPWASAVAGRLHDAFMDGLDRTLSAGTVPKDVRQAYDAARAFTRQRATAFGSQDLRGLRAKNPDGAYIADPSEGGRRFFNFTNASPEGPKSIADLADFIGNLKHQSAGLLSGEMREAARSYVVASLAKAAKLGEDQAFNPNAMVRFLEQNRQWMQGSGLFEKAQMDVFDRVLTYGKQLGRTENLRVAKNSSTNEKGETAKTFIDQVMSPWLKGGIAIGGAVFGHHQGGVIGMAISGGATHVASKAIAHAEGAMRELMATAAFDPRVAQDLMMKASAGNAKFLSPKRPSCSAISGSPPVRMSRRRSSRGSVRVRRIPQQIHHVWHDNGVEYHFPYLPPAMHVDPRHLLRVALRRAERVDVADRPNRTRQARVSIRLQP